MRLFSRRLFAWSLFTNFLCIIENKMQKCRTRSRFAEQSRSRSHRRPAAKLKIRLRSGERMLRSGRNDRLNRGDRPPDRCSANKKAGAFTHASQESQGRSLTVCISPRGSCRATIDIVHRDISFYRPLSFSVPDSNDGAHATVVNSRAPAARGP